MEIIWQFVLMSFCLLCTFIVCRYLYIVLQKTPWKNSTCSTNGVVKTVIIMGSGGHTTEMLKLTKHLNIKHYSPRVYIMSSTDTSSESKIHAQEAVRDTQYEVIKIPRSRNVNQSYLTSVFTTLFATLKSIPILLKLSPSLVLCNGPGTCVPICLVAFVMNMFWISDSKIIFVESICRVKTLSLSGKILMFFANDVIVQWLELKNNNKGTTYIGKLL